MSSCCLTSFTPLNSTTLWTPQAQFSRRQEELLARAEAAEAAASSAAASSVRVEEAAAARKEAETRVRDGEERLRDAERRLEATKARLVEQSEQCDAALARVRLPFNGPRVERLRRLILLSVALSVA